MQHRQKRARPLQLLNPATGGQFGPSTSSCRSRSHITCRISACCRIMPPDPHPDKLPKRPSLTWKAVVRMRRNLASQTIILALSQCTSGASCNAFDRIGRRSQLLHQIRQKQPLNGRTPLDSSIVRCRHRSGGRQEADSQPRAPRWPLRMPSRRRHCRIIPWSGKIHPDRHRQACCPRL